MSLPLREHARVILAAALDAADARAAVARALSLDGERLRIMDTEEVDLASIENVWVIGAGKAAC
ncbi:MAG TPA: DUF4147 domain-containing protein, partial [Longimicrobium sp.]|nr:DUF4147 domain-containing protein [Longimicrobium sp.]